MTKRKLKVLILMFPLILLVVWLFRNNNISNLNDLIIQMNNISLLDFGTLQSVFNSILSTILNINASISNIMAWYFSYMIIIEMVYLIYDLFVFMFHFIRLGDE